MSADDSTRLSGQFSIKRFRIAAIVIWTTLAILTALWEFRYSNEFKTANALTIARTFIEKDLVFRRWAAEHGGVYVPITDTTVPNPWLNVPERDITTPSGRRLTLVNPAYMTRQIFELSQLSGNPQERITSLKPIRPENAPDPWESRALTALDSGIGEFGEFQVLAGKPVFRYMRPLTTEKPCLQCHAAQGYREGMQRGGISIAIPTAEIDQSILQSNATHIGIIGIIWLFGLAGCLFSFNRIISATTALMTERDNLSAVFDATPMPMLLFDNRMEAVRVNRAFRNYCSNFDDYPDKRCGTILRCANALATPHGCGHSPACSSGLLLGALRKVLKNGLSSAHGEVTIPQAASDGSITELSLLYGVEAVSLDGQRHALLSFLDISDRKQMEKKLATSEQEFRSLAEIMPDNMARYDRDCRLLYINPALERTLEMPLETVIGKLPTELAPVGQYDEYQVTLARVIATGVDTEMELLLPNGFGGILYHHVKLVAERDPEGTVIGALIIGRNLTELKQLEKEQADRERQFRTLVEHSPDTIARYDQLCRRTYVNPALELLACKPASQLIGRTPIEAFVASPEVGQQVHDAVAQVLDQGLPLEIELSWKDAGSVTRHFLSRYVPESDANGEVTSVLSISRDITALRSAETQLQHAQKLESIGLLAGGVAHDFNNILAVIGGYAELLKITISGSDAVRAYVLEISDAVSRGAELTRSLLLFSGKQEPHKQHTDINLIVANLHKSMSRLLNADINLSVNLCDGQLPVLADRVQIEQIMVNLMVNARDALLSGGTIHITTAPAEVPEVVATADNRPLPGSYALITVADNGAGMDRETVARIFDPFFSTKESGKGTGLGLAIVSGIVANHGGHITVESSPGNGSVFSIYLPLYDSNQQPEHAPQPETPELRGNETILVVDDEPGLLMVISNVLAQYGYTVLTAADGVEALQIFATRRDEIQAVIIDLIMPRMNGRETIANMRQQKPDLPVILTSGYNDVVFDEPDISFLPKPVCFKKLTETLRAVLDCSENCLQNACSCVGPEMPLDSDGDDWL